MREKYATDMTPPPARSRLRSWTVRLAVIVAFVAAYFLVIRPLRIALIHELVGPALALIDTPRAHQFDLLLPPADPRVRLPALHNVQYYAPGGLYFWAPATLLLAYAPRRPYWLIHGAIVVALGLLGFVCFAIGYGWADWGFDAQRFVEGYLLRTVSLGYPLLVVYGHLQATDSSHKREPSRFPRAAPEGTPDKPA